MDGVLTARTEALAGFDPIALRVPTSGELDGWRQRLDEPRGIVTGHAGQLLVGPHDPDGIETRLYASETPRTGTETGNDHVHYACRRVTRPVCLVMHTEAW